MQEVANITIWTDHKIKFKFPIPVEKMKASVILSQNGSRILEFTSGSSSLTLSENEIILSLTPSETGKFSANDKNSFAIAQINLLYEGVRHATRPVRIPIHSNLKAEVMQ